MSSSTQGDGFIEVTHGRKKRKGSVIHNCQGGPGRLNGGGRKFFCYKEGV